MFRPPSRTLQGLLQDEEKNGWRQSTGPAPFISAPIGMSHPRDITRPGSTLGSPVLSQGAESQYDVIAGPLPQASGGVHALLDGMYTELSRRREAQQLLLLTRQRHLLALSRQCVVHQRSLMDYIEDIHERLHQSPPPAPPLLSAMCLKLRKVASYSASLHRRLRSDPCLYPVLSTSMLDATRDVPRLLLLMAVKAVLLTERYVLRVLHRAAQVPAEVTPDLCRALTVYNQVVADLSKPARPLAELRPFCLSRVLEVLAEERGRALAGELRGTWFEGGLLEDLLETEPTNSLQRKSQVIPGLEVIGQEDIARTETHMTQAADPASRPAKMSQEVSGQRSFRNLGVVLQEDRSHVTPVLQILVGLDQKLWNKVASVSEAALYSQYCSHLWPALYTQVFHDVSSGMRGPRTPPALLLLPNGGCARALQILRATLVSEGFPEPCVSMGRLLCERLACLHSLIAWDSTLCQALSSALTDKCAASSLGGGDLVPGNHSRTSGILVTLCRHLSGLQLTPSSTHRSAPGPRNLSDHLFSPPWSELHGIISQEGVLSRCTVSLHLCDMWLRSRAQIFMSSGSLSQLVLITHGDLPVIKARCRSLVAAAESADFLSSTQTSCMRMKRSRDVLEGLVVSLPHVLGSVCSRRAQDFFQHMMPAGRHWRGKLVTGPDLAPSEYAQAALGELVLPVLDGATSLCLEEQGSAVCVVLGVFMEAWMGHILREKIKFSLQGALQLRRDFESVRDLLRSQESRMPPEVVQAALALPVFAQADNAIVCLLQQPSRKAYLQSGSCAIFSCCPPLCRVAVDSMSDSLQSLDSLERRAWDGDVSRRVPRHSHDSYLPHNQRQWLSLRVHKTWNGLHLPWEGREVSEG